MAFFVKFAVLGIDALVDGFMVGVEILDEDGSDLIAESALVFGECFEHLKVYGFYSDAFFSILFHLPIL